MLSNEMRVRFTSFPLLFLFSFGAAFIGSKAPKRGPPVEAKNSVSSVALGLRPKRSERSSGCAFSATGLNLPKRRTIIIIVYLLYYYYNICIYVSLCSIYEEELKRNMRTRPAGEGLHLTRLNRWPKAPSRLR